MKKDFGKKVCGVLAALTIAASMTTVPAFAAQDFDPEFFGYIEPDKFWHQSEYTMGFGEYKPNQFGNNFNREDMTMDYELPFGSVPGSVYRAVSSNNNVVTAYVEGTGVQLNGISNGKATITLQKQTGSTWTTIDTVNVTVNGTSTLTSLGNYEHIYPLGISGSGLTIQGRHPNAVYTYTVDKSGLEVYEYKNEKGELTGGINCNATEYGDYVLTVKETLNGVTKEFQKVTMHVKPTVVNDTAIFKISDVGTTSNIISNRRVDRSYVYRMSDGTKNHVHAVNQHISIAEEFEYDYGKTTRCMIVQNENGRIDATMPGTCVIDVYEYNHDSSKYGQLRDIDFDTNTEGMIYIGTCTVTVVE